MAVGVFRVLPWRTFQWVLELFELLPTTRNATRVTRNAVFHYLNFDMTLLLSRII